MAPAVADVSKVVASVSNVAASLNPYKLTKDPDEVAQQLNASFSIAPPDGYVGGFGVKVELLGQKQMQFVALIPKGTRPSDIFEGSRNEIRFNPGSSTISLAAQFNRSDRDEMREAITRMAGGDGQSEPLKEVYIEAGGRKSRHSAVLPRATVLGTLSCSSFSTRADCFLPLDPRTRLTKRRSSAH